jgi:hypothetical protein
LALRTLSIRRAALVALPSIALACSLQQSGDADSDGAQATSATSNDAGQHADAPTSHANVDSAASSGGNDDSQSDDASSGVPDVIVYAPDASPSADGGDPCDRDGDGHRAIGATCGGDDCCDYDGRAFKGQTAFFATPNVCESFDYDCDGKLTEEFPTVACKLGFFTCSGDGFQSATPCGQSNEFVSCNFAVVACGESKASKAQECR